MNKLPIIFLIAFALTFLLLQLLQNFLPHDKGRAFAVNGAKSAGKPRGAGIIFIFSFSVVALIFTKFTLEHTIYIFLTFAAMMSGYLDDRADTPWGEFKKGIIDLVISICLAVTFLHYNSNIIEIPFTNTTLEIPKIIFGILIIILVWASINVTNCSDGVDGLCATLCLITFANIFLLMSRVGHNCDYKSTVLIMFACVLAYLWFNTSPSLMLMGDAGSRALGFFIAVAFLKTQSPLLYILSAIMLIIDGGLGLVKLTIIRVTKNKNFMKNLRTPIHDHLRKNKNWSDTQVVIRFAILQILFSLLTFMA